MLHYRAPDARLPLIEHAIVWLRCVPLHVFALDDEDPRLLVQLDKAYPFEYRSLVAKRRAIREAVLATQRSTLRRLKEMAREQEAVEKDNDDQEDEDDVEAAADERDTTAQNTGERDRKPRTGPTDLAHRLRTVSEPIDAAKPAADRPPEPKQQREVQRLSTDQQTEQIIDPALAAVIQMSPLVKSKSTSCLVDTSGSSGARARQSHRVSFAATTGDARADARASASTQAKRLAKKNAPLGMPSTLYYCSYYYYYYYYSYYICDYISSHSYFPYY